MTHEEKLKIASSLFDNVLYDEDEDDPREFFNDAGEKLYFINMGDVFAWGCADSEAVTLDELMEAYQYAKASEYEWNGWIEWVAQRRDEPPQIPVIIEMARRQEGKLRIPWYSKSRIANTKKLWAVQKAVKAGASIDQVRDLLAKDYV